MTDNTHSVLSGVVIFDGCNIDAVKRSFLDIGSGRHWVQLFLHKNGRLSDEAKAKLNVETTDLCAEEKEMLALLDKDFSKSAPQIFYEKDGSQESTAVGAERSLCWSFFLRAFPPPFDHYLRNVGPGDIFSFWLKVVMKTISHVPPAQQRVNRARFYNLYIKKSEPFIAFLSRLRVAADSLGKVRELSDDDIRDSLLRGAAHHARWEATDEPQPHLQHSRFYSFITMLESEERTTGTKYSQTTLETRLTQYDRANPLRPVTKSASPQALLTDSLPSKRRMIPRVCWYYLQPSGCKNKNNCKYHHLKGALPPGILPAKKPLHYDSKSGSTSGTKVQELTSIITALQLQLKEQELKTKEHELNSTTTKTPAHSNGALRSTT